MNGAGADESASSRLFSRMLHVAGIRREAETAVAVPHHPYVRALHLDWEELSTGYQAQRVDQHRFEVFCAACGDIDGPKERQPAPARELRGPYDSKRLASRAARKHEFGSVRKKANPRGMSFVDRFWDEAIETREAKFQARHRAR